MKSWVLRATVALVLALVSLAAGTLPATASAVHHARRPVITSMSLHMGKSGGGQVVIVRGFHFRKVSDVTFGRVSAAKFRVLSPRRIRMWTPPQDDVLLHVRVRLGPDRASRITRASRFQFVEPPVVTRQSIQALPTKGGTIETFTGADFIHVRAVTVAGVPVRHLHVLSPRRLSFTTPAHTAGTILARIHTDFGTSRAWGAALLHYANPPRVFDLRVPDGPTTGGNRVELSSDSLSRTPTVTFDGIRATGARRETNGNLSVLAPPHAVGLVHVVVSDAMGASRPTDDDLYRYGPPNPLQWSQPAPADPYRTVISIACPTATFCVAGDDNGNVLTSSSGGWGTPEHLPGTSGAATVSCSTATHCLATDLGTPTSGRIYTYDGSAWAAETLPYHVTAASCLMGGQCVAVDRDGNFLTEGPSGWAADRIADAALSGISCASVGNCLATTSLGTALEQVAGTWQNPVDLSTVPGAPPAARATALTCPADGNCFVGTGRGVVLHLSRGRWAAATHVVDNAPTTSISCTSPSLCVLVGGRRTAVFDGTDWSATADVPGMTVPFAVTADPDRSFTIGGVGYVARTR